MRKPAQIIGHDALTQLAFEGYKVVRIERCACGDDIEDDADVCEACGRHEDFGPAPDPQRETIKMIGKIVSIKIGQPAPTRE